MTEDVAARIAKFRQELENDRDFYLKWARRNYCAAYGLAIIAVVSSAAAGILGLGFDVDRKIIALMALIPAIAVTADSQFKWQEKANWHYRRRDATKKLIRCIDYELPRHPTPDWLAKLSQGYSVTEAEMTDTWGKDLSLEVREVAEAAADKVTEGEHAAAHEDTLQDDSR